MKGKFKRFMKENMSAIIIASAILLGSILLSFMIRYALLKAALLISSDIGTAIFMS